MTALPDFVDLKPLLGELPATRSAEVTVLRYRVKLITPMMGGGVEAGKPDTHQPIRARSLRGQFRFWWRVLARGGMFGSCVSSSGAPSPNDWRNWERSVWGGMGDKPDELAASTIGLAVSEVTPPKRFGFDCAEFGVAMGRERMPGNDAEHAHGWCRYVFFSAEGRQDQPAKTLIASGLQFTLAVSVKSTDPVRIKMARQVVSFWASFGGIGSRTRRGAGAVQVNELLAGGQEALLCALADGSAKRCKSIRVAAEPALTSAYQAFKASIVPMIEFRQWPDLARDGTKGSPRTYGLSHWPEAHEIRKAAGVSIPAHAPGRTGWAGRDYPMPRAAFGLPIVVHFKDRRNRTSTADDSGFDPADRTILPVVNDVALERMASPLILRPIAVSASSFRPCTVFIDSSAMGDQPLEWVAITPSDAAHATNDVWAVWDATWPANALARGARAWPQALPWALSDHETANGLPGEFSPAQSAVEAFFNSRLVRAHAQPNP